ncbi:conserved domain protein [Verrucomicrobiia bacterium DG1235]|nr:conserved domain protein [Verrucomicrobiae bacterium DG1235]
MKRFSIIIFSVLSLLLAAVEAEEGMVLVPEGEFVMGADNGAYDERPAHVVRLSSYWIDRCEVTNAQFAKYARESERLMSIEGTWFRYSIEGCLDLIEHLESEYGGAFSEVETKALSVEDFRVWSAVLLALGEQSNRESGELDALASVELRSDEILLAGVARQANHPVRGVSWRDARSYANWHGKRLPTEAEWEKAARGTSEAAYPWGDEWKELSYEEVYPVDGDDSLESPYGCVGMSGNVWEWIEDWYGEAYYSEEEKFIDPRGPEGLENGALPTPYSETAHLRTVQQGRESDTRKVIRGGGFGGSEKQARFNFRTTRRLWSNPNYWHADIGFRCVKDI